MVETSSDISIMVERLHKLEQNTHRLRFGLIAVGLLVIAAVLLSARTAVTHPASQSFDTLNVHSFILRDSTGKVRAGLFVTKDGQPVFELVDTAGRAPIVLSLKEDGEPTLDLYDAADTKRLTLALTSDGRSGLALLDANGHARAGLTAGGLFLLDSSGTGRAGLLAPSDDHMGGLGLWDASGTLRLLIELTNPNAIGQGGGAASITAYDKARRLVDQWPSRSAVP